jgi:hypothetical protein
MEIYERLQQSLRDVDWRSARRCRRGRQFRYTVQSAVCRGGPRIVGLLACGYHSADGAEQAVRRRIPRSSLGRRTLGQHSSYAAEQAVCAGVPRILGGAFPIDGNCPGEFRKIGSGVTQAEAGMFSGENGLEDGKIGGCHAIAPTRLAGMSAQYAAKGSGGDVGRLEMAGLRALGCGLGADGAAVSVGGFRLSG